MPDINIQHIAGGLALFFITIAIYKALSQKASKRAAAARSIAQSHEGQEPLVSLHDPFSSGVQPPGAPGPSGVPPPPSAAAIPKAPAPVPAVAQTPSQGRPQQAQAATTGHPEPEQIYKWN